MSIEEQPKGGSRMKQPGQEAASVQVAGQPGGETAARAPKAAATPRRGAQGGKSAEVDYERLATMVAGKLAPAFAPRGTETGMLDVG
jgi:hypothetical protein